MAVSNHFFFIDTNVRWNRTASCIAGHSQQFQQHKVESIWESHRSNYEVLSNGYMSTASLPTSCASASLASNHVPDGILGKFDPAVSVCVWHLDCLFLYTVSKLIPENMQVRGANPFTNYFASFIDMHVSAGLRLKTVPCQVACCSSAHFSYVIEANNNWLPWKQYIEAIQIWCILMHRTLFGVLFKFYRSFFHDFVYLMRTKE